MVKYECSTQRRKSFKNYAQLDRRSQYHNFLRTIMSLSVFCFSALLLGAFSFGIDTDRTTTGAVARYGQFPHHVILRNISSAEHICSGAIISAQVVLTAAHCVHGISPINSIDIVYAQLVPVHLNHVKSVEISKRRIHPGYGPKTTHNDIALLLTTSPFHFDHNVQLASLPLHSLPNLTETMHITGWSRYRVSVDR